MTEMTDKRLDKIAATIARREELIERENAFEDCTEEIGDIEHGLFAVLPELVEAVREARVHANQDAFVSDKRAAERDAAEKRALRAEAELSAMTAAVTMLTSERDHLQVKFEAVCRMAPGVVLKGGAP